MSYKQVRQTTSIYLQISCRSCLLFQPYQWLRFEVSMYLLTRDNNHYMTTIKRMTPPSISMHTIKCKFRGVITVSRSHRESVFSWATDPSREAPRPGKGVRFLLSSSVSELRNEFPWETEQGRLALPWAMNNPSCSTCSVTRMTGFLLLSYRTIRGNWIYLA